jgi:hypothetical protein
MRSRDSESSGEEAFGALGPGLGGKGSSLSTLDTAELGTGAESTRSSVSRPSSNDMMSPRGEMSFDKDRLSSWY